MTDSDLRETMARLALRPSSLARALGVHVTTVSRWAHGVIPIPQYVAAYLALYEKSVPGRAY